MDSRCHIVVLGLVLPKLRRICFKEMHNSMTLVAFDGIDLPGLFDLDLFN